MKGWKYQNGYVPDPFRRSTGSEDNHPAPLRKPAGNPVTRRRGQQRRQRIYEFVRDYQLEQRKPPTVREIMEAVGLASESTTHKHLVILETESKLACRHGEARGWHIPDLRATEERAIEALSARLVELVDEFDLDLNERPELRVALLLGEAVIGDA